jgi:guanine deaminase
MPVSEQGHILVVEKNDITRKLIVGILNNKGYETYEAKSGDEATAFLAKPLQLLVLDIETGNLENLGLLHKLRMTDSRLPVILLAEEADQDAIRARIGVEQISVMKKPVMPETLLQSIQEYLLPGIAEKIEAETVPAAQASDPRDPDARARSEAFMRRAIDLSQEKMDANCGGPFGAVIVRGGKIIAEGWNQVTSSNDPTAHAEMVAIREACKAVGDFSLAGCEIYTSCEPCPMCLAALYWARIDRIYFGNTREDAAHIGFDDDFIYREFTVPEDKRALPAKMFLRDEAKIVFESWLKKADKTLY